MGYLGSSLPAKCCCCFSNNWLFCLVQFIICLAGGHKSSLIKPHRHSSPCRCPAVAQASAATAKLWHLAAPTVVAADCTQTCVPSPDIHQCCIMLQVMHVFCCNYIVSYLSRGPCTVFNINAAIWCTRVSSEHESTRAAIVFCSFWAPVQTTLKRQWWITFVLKNISPETCNTSKSQELGFFKNP